MAEDRELVGRIVEDGDETAFCVLFHRHSPALYQFILRLLGGDERDAEDVLQEIWMTAAAALPRFRWESSLRTFLTGIALNRSRMFLRRRGCLHFESPARDFEPALPAAQDAPRIDLEQAIALLPAGYRTVLVLHDVEGFTHEEIGRRLEISPGTSRSQLHFARRTLRRLLGSQGAEHDGRRDGCRADVPGTQRPARPVTREAP